MDIKQVMTQARFWHHVSVVPAANSDACWEWQGAKTPTGYGITRKEYAHRYVAGLTTDVKGKVVAHRCDNPGCVRPDHLFVTDQLGNVRDMWTKQRANSKLDRTKVLDIRTRRISQSAFAKLYNVTRDNIGKVQRGQTWQHIV